MQHFFKTLLTLAAAAGLSQSAGAQTTGSFDTDITFMAQARKLSVYVPTNYNPANSYRLMICLHGLGDNSINYRNALISSLSWNTYFANTIFVCPDGGSDRNKDFYMPAGDEAIVQESINYAKANYNIDASNVMLQGFSLGGKSAFKYATTHPTAFKGLLLNTPAIQGVKDAVRPVTDGGLDYAAAKQIPVYITHGGQDILYGAPIDSFYRNLVLNDYKTRLIRIPSMAHSIPAFANVPDMNTYLDAPTPAGTDAEAVEVVVPSHTCDAQVAAKVLVRNAAATAITSIDLKYTLNGAIATHTWTGNIGAYEHAFITMPNAATTAGDNTYTVEITAVNGSADPSTNNTQAAQFVREQKGLALPVTEGFEGNIFPPAGWVNRAAGDVYSTWTDDDQSKKSGKKSMNAFNTIMVFDNAGRKEELESPMLDLSSIQNPFISFDVAFNYHKYTKAIWGIDSTFADTLEVLISTDCGSTYTSLYKKGGADLATWPTPITDPTSIQASYTAPKNENWRNEIISLRSYAQNKEAIVMFRYTSAMGGCINIDNISFTDKVMKVDEAKTTKMKLYPNPATNNVNVTAEANITDVTVTDISGKKMMTVANDNNGNQVSVNTASLPDGLYLFQIKTAQGIGIEKVMIRR